jgi:hypothetical protein
MVLQLAEPMMIEDPRRHPPETLDSLQLLLAEGALAHADPRHENFYELENGSRIFYVYLSPASHKVILLATWPRAN